MRSPQLGEAKLLVASIHGRSTVLTARSRSPLRLLTPRQNGPGVWAYTSSYGGGMLAGDTNVIDVTVNRGACCFLTTQSTTKIYKSPGRSPSRQCLKAAVEEEASLLHLPDPIQCFAESVYLQEQTFHLAPNANLVLLDWFCSGRWARGERWAFHRYASKNKVYQTGRLTLLDSVVLENACPAEHRRFTTGEFHCLATLIILGPKFAPFASASLDRVNKQQVAPKAEMLVSASSLQDGLIMRVAGSSVEQVGCKIHTHLQFVTALLKDDPWARKW